MSLTNPNKLITEERLSDFYQQILPYMGGLPEVVNNKFSKGDLYSTDEKMIGQWIDGKPLYQKVVMTISPASSTENVIFTGDSDFDIKRFDGYIEYMASGSTRYMPLNFIVGQTSISTWVANSPNAIRQTISKTYLNCTEVLIIQYTKTTDSPISIGSDTDYSTDEKIVGTWVDGKPIWQKTLFSNTINTGNTSMDHNIVDLGIVINGIGFTAGSTGKARRNITMSYYNDDTWDCCFYVNDTNIIIQAGSKFANAHVNDGCYITIQYTKTTD